MDQSDTSSRVEEPSTFIAGGGEMGERTRAFDWSRTPLGPIEAWPQSLVTVVRVMLNSRYAMWIGWGPELTFFYNDAYASMTLGPKHPWALGRSAREVWSEIWSDLGPRAESVVETGQATWDEGLLLFLERSGFREETYHTFSYSPVPDDSGNVGGMLCVVTEDTDRTIGERRLRTLRELAARTAEEPKSIDEACRRAAAVLSANPLDVPFALFYLLDDEGQNLRLTGSAGIDPETKLSPRVVSMLDPAAPWPFQGVAESGRPVEVNGLAKICPQLTAGAWPEPPNLAIVLPMSKPGQTQLAGFVVLGISPRRPLDDGYRGFVDLVVGQVATAVANARAYEEERRRVEELARLDHAKTAFFSNVSHEFRTPLTLMLGPVEDILAEPPDEASRQDRERLEVVHRNGLRLLRLVNTLLDFSRIEAGRVRASYQPTDLATLTAELASVFRSACEKAGLGLVVGCPPLGEPIYVDREMWEKVVLNLISNAFKFTLRGEISVSLHLSEHVAELRVRDTGTGIPASEMPRLFERFHRVENAQGRTHEGSGIGLALVQELVRLHGGSVVAESTLGEGSTFIVTIPLGSKHLPADQVEAGRTESLLVGVGLANPYVEESLRWLPDAVQGAEERVVLEARPDLAAGPGVRTWSPDESERPRILVADDNADMRQYVARLLSDHFRVDAVADGVAAVEAVRRKVPDLILSDVMMPRLDGFGFLREMRSDARTSSIPFILLSARAGEESRVEGLQAGADDYLVKPFSARELLARVSAQLQMARIRQESSETLRRSEERLRMALTAARMVAWQYDPGRDRLIASENAADVFGLTTDFSLETSAEGGSLIHPEDLERHVSEFRKVVAEGGSYFSQFRMVRPKDDSVIWLEERAQAIGDREAGTFQVVGVVLDITERKRAEMELRDARSRLESTLAAGEVGTWEFDPVNDAMHADPNLARMFGVSAEDAAGGTNQTYLRAVHPEDRNRVSEIINQALNVGEAYEADYRLVGPSGSIRWVIARGRVERDEAGKAVRLPGVVVDITAQREAEERFAQLAIETERERRLFDTVLTSIPDFIFVFSPDGRFVYANKALLELWGLSRDEAIGKTMAELKYPWDVEAQILRDIDIVVETGRTVEDGTWYMSPSGTTGYYEYTLAPVFGTEGDVVQVAGTARDILDRKRAEEAVRRSEERLRLIVENAKDFAIITLDQAGIITGWNSGAANIFGYQESEVLGRDGRVIFTPEDREQGRPEYEMEQALQAGRVENERWHINKAGERFWASGLVTPLKDGETAVGFLKIMRDMTEARRSHEMLEKQAEALREADRRKDEFLATLAHELRNPLAPVRNGLQIMRMAGDDRRVIDEARTLMERQVSHMVRLIDDLMDVSRITRGKLKLRRDRVELATVVHSAVEASRPLVEAAEHELAVTMPTRPIVVDADPTRLAQVISNLLNNAAKYTESGGNITLTVEREASDVVVTVRDNGVGIPAEMLPHVFDMFTQVDRSLERSQGGLGIGLTLVKRLVEMHSGSVEARSGGPGRGSEFEVRLPLAAELVPESSSKGNSNNSKASVKGRKILVVDDNYDSAKTLARLLKMMGHEARIAHDGGEAVTQADDYRPDLIILDIGLPIMNGYDVATAIRSLDWGKNIPIVALTGWGQEGDRRRSREAGIDRHLVKPLDPSILESLLTNLPESRR